MLGYLIRRLMAAIFVLLGASLIAFLLLEYTPGDAVDVMIGETATEAQMEAMRQEFGLDRPLAERYLAYITQAVWEGDLGTSLSYDRPVSQMVMERFAFTIKLVMISTVVALFIGILIGLLAAANPGSKIDLGLMSLSALGISIPTFWVALMLMLVFAVRLGWLPVAGSGSARHLVMPVICLTLPIAAVVARLTRASLINIRGEDYVRAARARGTSTYRVWLRHILRNGLVPVITVLGLQLGHMLSGTFIIETIFALPGLGRLAVDAIFTRDFPLVLGSVLLVALIYQVLNLGVDILQAVLDPTIRQEVFK